MPKPFTETAGKVLQKGQRGKALLIGGVGLIAGGALAGERIHRALTYKRDYEKMLDFSPEIKNFDQKAVKARFDTLRRFNPEMSRDPLVSSSWIKQTIEFPAVTPSMLRDVVGTRERGAVSAGDIMKTVSRLPAPEL